MCRYAALLRYATHPSGAGKGLFISYGTDLTLTQQRYTQINEKEGAGSMPLHARADPRFFFNRQLLAPLLGMPSCDVLIALRKQGCTGFREGLSSVDGSWISFHRQSVVAL